MKNIKRNMKKRAGFTLVELLIVIIIIGILAGAMLLVAGSGTDKAEATKIISDMRGIKAAALMYYADKGSDASMPTIAALSDYMDRDINLGETTNPNYAMVPGKDDDDDDDPSQWWIERSNVKASVGDKMSGDGNEVAISTGLYADAKQDDDAPYAGGTGKVYMRAR